MEGQTLTARVTRVDRVVSRAGKGAFVLSLDCQYLALLHFTSGLASNQVKKRKREKKGLPESKLRVETALLDNGKRRPVEAEIGFVSPLDANAIVAVAEAPGIDPKVGSTLEFALVRTGQPLAG